MIFVYSFVITVPVMAFAKVSATHKDAVGLVYKTVQEEYGVYAAGAHDPDHPNMRGILKTRNPCRISRCIAAPVAQKTEYFWFK